MGGATVDLWLSSGWMPLAEPTAEPERKPAKFDRAEVLDIVRYVTSLAPSFGNPAVPFDLDISHANVAEGFSLFALNCAPCHTITGAGDALAGGIQAPPLHGVTKTMVWEAVRTGPGNMPRFGPGTISPSQVVDIVGYVVKNIEHPTVPVGSRSEVSARSQRASSGCSSAWAPASLPHSGSATAPRPRRTKAAGRPTVATTVPRARTATDGPGSDDQSELAHA